MTPTIPMSEFFALPEVIAAQEIQKRNPYGSAAHRDAFDRLKSIAACYNAESFIGEY